MSIFRTSLRRQLPSVEEGSYWFTYADHDLCLERQDRDIADNHRIRVIISGDNRLQAVISVPPPDDGSKVRPNIQVSRLVATRMGIPQGRSVRYLNGNTLDLRRSNLADGGRAKSPFRCSVSPIQNPPGTHRHRVGNERPVEVYHICTGPRNGYFCLRRNIIAIATRTAPASTLWTVRMIASPGERSEPMAFHDLHTVIHLVGDYDSATSSEQEMAVS